MVARSNPALIFTSTSRSIQNLQFLVPTSQVYRPVKCTDQSSVMYCIWYWPVKYYHIVYLFMLSFSQVLSYCTCIYRYRLVKCYCIVLYLHLNVPAGQVLLYCIVFAFTGTDRSNVIILYIYFTGWSSIILLYIHLQVPSGQVLL